VRFPRWGIASVAVVIATVLVVGGVDAWVSDATSRGAEGLSASALRSVELAHDMRWQLSRLEPASTGRAEQPAQALEWLARDIESYEPLATFEGERPEWLTLAGLAHRMGEAMARGDHLAVARDATSAAESVDRLIAINRTEAGAIGHRMLVLGRRQVLVDALGGALVLLVVVQVAASRLRAMARERQAAARTVEILESKNRELEAFAARAAHDLRTPLVPIHGLASLIVRSGRDEADARLAGRIVGAASRMSAIIEAMLVFSRSGRLPRGRSEVRAVVSEVLEELVPTSEGAELHVAPVEAMVDCPPEVLGQILRNVIGNALKYRAPQRRCRLDIAIRKQPAWVTIDIVDNGTGMDPGAARRAFEPFFRATSDGTGHGLGLAIVDSYVRALHGSVELASEVGVGTRVSILLPRSVAAASASQSAASPEVYPDASEASPLPGAT
jgi:signal transduction histidine kinase